MEILKRLQKKIYNQNNSTFALNRIQSVRDRQLILNDEEFWKHVDNPEEFGPVDNNKKQLVLKRIGQLYEVATKFKDEMEPKFFTAMMELGSIDN